MSQHLQFGLCCIIKSKGHFLRPADKIVLAVFNPLGPKSDQNQFSPNKISRSSRVKDMRITKLITRGRIFSQVFLKEIYVDQSGEFVCGSGGLKDLKGYVTRILLF